jgi:hypothetical protein
VRLATHELKNFDRAIISLVVAFGVRGKLMRA